jgi:hypothetical protein
MAGVFDNDLGANQEIEIAIDLQVLASRLVKDQKFIDAVAKAVRNQLLKDARSMKTLFAQWGGTK